MIHNLLFCFLIGMITAYLLELLTNRLLKLYQLCYTRQPIYYLLAPLIAFLVTYHVKLLPITDQIITYWISYSFLCLLLIVAVMDYYTLEVRHRFVLLIALLGIFQYLLLGKPSLMEMSIGFFAASLPLLIISILTQGSIGGGDIKLLASCGLILGPVSILVGTFLAIILGGISGIFLLIFHKKQKQDAIPFVPFLALGLGIAYLYGASLLNWYLSFFS